MLRVTAHARGVMALAAGFLLGGQGSAAIASPHHPTGDYQRFSDCPLDTVALEDCVLSITDGGAVTVGHRTVPIDKAVTVQGGFYSRPGDRELTFVGAEDGNTLSSTQLTIPGGLTGLVPVQLLPSSLRTQLSASPAGVTMTMQLAKPAGAIRLSTENFLFQKGVALQLPLKIKLSNRFLGDSCYVGSSSKPVVLNMTTGVTSPPAPNRPIKGLAGNLEFFDEFTLTVLTGASLVDNAFAAPEATGCGGSNAPLVDKALDASIGLPSPSGRNTAVLDSSFDLAIPETVRESE